MKDAPCQLVWQVSKIGRLTRTSRAHSPCQLAWQVKEIERLTRPLRARRRPLPACLEGEADCQALRAYPESSFSLRGRGTARANAHQDQPQGLVTISAALTPGPSPASGRGEVLG